MQKIIFILLSFSFSICFANEPSPVKACVEALVEAGVSVNGQKVVAFNNGDIVASINDSTYVYTASGKTKVTSNNQTPLCRHETKKNAESFLAGMASALVSKLGEIEKPSKAQLEKNKVVHQKCHSIPAVASIVNQLGPKPEVAKATGDNKNQTPATSQPNKPANQQKPATTPNKAATKDPNSKG